jgi:hydrogenase maturation protein HypF
VSTFEGEASMTLQYYAERWSEEPGEGSLVEKPEWVSEEENGALEMTTERLFKRIADSMIDAIESGEDKEQLMRTRERLAWEFHQGLADGVVQMCLAIRERTGLDTAALSGGVFQNRLLLRMCEDGLKAEGFEVLIHSMVPPNDGGICLGQAAAAARALYKKKTNDPARNGGETVQRTVEQIDELHM